MNFNKIFTLAAIVFAGFIQSGCGNANQNTMGYTQAVNGVCPAGTTLSANNMCAPSGVNTGYNNYNNGYPNNTGTCAQGPSYQYTGGTYGSCGVGYVLQGLTCTCQTSGTLQGTTGYGSTQGSCQLQGYFYVQGGCYQQGPCMQGYAYVTPTGMCYRVQ